MLTVQLYGSDRSVVQRIIIIIIIIISDGTDFQQS